MSHYEEEDFEFSDDEWLAEALQDIHQETLQNSPQEAHQEYEFDDDEWMLYPSVLNYRSNKRSHQDITYSNEDNHFEIDDADIDEDFIHGMNELDSLAHIFGEDGKKNIPGLPRRKRIRTSINQQGGRILQELGRCSK